jgi:general secretion pathway protein F
MPIFNYKGYRLDGSSITGSVEADGFNDAVSIIKEKNILPKIVTEYIHSEKRRLSIGKHADLLPHVTRQMSTLMSSGVTLMETLKSLSEENTGFWRGVLVDLKERVAGGASMSRALEAHNKLFPVFYVNMVAAGETSGALDKVLARLADFLEMEAAIRAKVRAAMIYPVFMICTGFVVMAFIFTFVIPKIVRIFEQTKAALPFITVVLIFVSNLFVNYWWVFLGLIIGGIYGIRTLRLKKRRMLDNLKLKAPGNVLQSLYYARFARTLGFLLEGGIQMLRALDLSAKSTGNVVLEERIRDALKQVAEGTRLSASLQGFPPVLIQLISTGEKSGNMAAVLNNAASSYENEFDRKVKQALSLIEPIMILSMGIAVGFIVLAVLLPMFQLNQLVK